MFRMRCNSVTRVSIAPQVIDNIGSVFRVAVPMLLYFSIMWTGTFFGCWRLGLRYEDSVVQAFTASSNNFELAIAVAVGVFGINSAVRFPWRRLPAPQTLRYCWTIKYRNLIAHFRCQLCTINAITSS